MKRSSVLCLILLVLFTGCGVKHDETIVPAQNVQESEQILTESTAAPDDAKTPISMGFVNAAGEEYVSLYQSASDDATAVARMYTGEPIEIYALEGQWYYVKYGDIFGYTSTKSISFTEPEETQVQSVPSEAVTQAAVETAAGGGQQPVEVNITLQFDTDGIALPISYVDYVPYETTRNAYCSAESCYIYKTASTAGPKREADMLYQGDAITVYGTYDGFYYIGTDSGSGYDLKGYVQTKYITLGTPPAAENKSYSATAGCVDVASCNVRSSPSKENDANVIDTLYKGAVFSISSFDGYWYYITYDGGSGYVSYKMVTVY